MKPLLALLFVACLAGCYSSEPQKTDKEGKAMPEFKLLLTDSTTWVNTATQYSGTPIVLFYFSPYCPYCRAQTKEILEDIDKLKAIHFYFISNFPLESLKAYDKEFDLLKHSNISLGMDVSKSIADYFEVPGVPYMAIYNKNKKLNKSFLGGRLYSSQIMKLTNE